jgi:hypothetical protein
MRDEMMALPSLGWILNVMYLRSMVVFFGYGQRPGCFIALTQLQKSLPTIKEEAEACNSALDAFASGQAVGDGIGSTIGID